MENINAVLIEDELSQKGRLIKLKITIVMGWLHPVECIEVSQQRNGNVFNVKPPTMRAMSLN